MKVINIFLNCIKPGQRITAPGDLLREKTNQDGDELTRWLNAISDKGIEHVYDGGGDKYVFTLKLKGPKLYPADFDKIRP